MITQVFFINDRTFKYFLEYMFSGTCAAPDVLFIREVITLIHGERMAGLQLSRTYGYWDDC